MDVNARMEVRTLAARDEIRAVQEGLAGLRPPSRAALDLIYRQRLSPAEVGRISGVDESSVEEWRVAALGELAKAMNVSGPEVAASMLERAADNPPEINTVAADAETAERVSNGRSRGKSPDSRNRRSLRVVVLAGTIAFVLAVCAIAIALSGDDDGAAPAPSASAPSAESSANEGAKRPDPPAEATELSPLPGVPGSASIAVTPPRAGTQTVELELSGLPQPDARYEAWLYTSVLDSVSLGSIDSGEGTIEAELPSNAGDFEFLDVSIQDDGDEAHSGRSIFRAPTDALDGER